MISIRNLHKSYGSHAVLRDVSLDIAAGETVALLGASGSGKTTLLRCIIGLENFTDGSIEVDGVCINEQTTAAERASKLRTIRKECGYVFQQYHLFPHLTVLQNLMLAPVRVKNESDGIARDRSMQLLEQVGLTHKSEQRPIKLSGGEQQRVAIARALAMQPKYLLYDEPTSALDGLRAQEIWGIMRNLAERKLTQVIVTHQEQLVQAVDCRVLRMVDGALVAEQASA